MPIIDPNDKTYIKPKPPNSANKSSKSPNSAEMVFVPNKPKFTFDDLILSNKIKDQIFDILSIRKNSDYIFEKWGFNQTHKHQRKVAINFYGPPGTGKTMAAHAVASYLEKDIIEVSYADIESKYVGDTPKNLKKVFNIAETTNSVLFFDEADAILSKRVTNMSSSTDTSVNQTRSVLLMLLNDYKGDIVFATNFITNIDSAFMRRILGHILFDLPDEAERIKIWQHLLPPSFPNSLNVEEIASQFSGISGSDISTAILKTAYSTLRQEKDIAEHNSFVEEISKIIASNQHNAGNNEAEISVKKRIVSEDYVKQQLSKEEL